MRQKGGIEIIVMLLVILAAFVLVGGSFNFKNSTLKNGTAVNVKDIIPNPGYKNLQIRDLQSSTPPPAPLPTGLCDHDNGNFAGPNCTCGAFLLECKNKACARLISVGYTQGNFSSPNPDPAKSCDYTEFGRNIKATFDKWCSMDSFTRGRDGIFCIGKPVIYLYPTIDTFVNVKLTIPGEITESIPLYPEGGWQNVLAHPNGKLEYQGKTYNELYFESAVNKVNPPKKGMVIEKNNLEKELKTLTFKLGLIDKEQREFLDYWLPKLQQINSPFIFISILEKEEKERIDGVEINPIPDTRIEFLAYFKGLDKRVSVEPLVLPENPPQRVGFTAVEWGGTIDRGN